MHWDVDPKAAKRLDEIATRRQGRRKADPRHRPRPRGRGHLLARAADPRPQEGARRHPRRARRVQRRDQGGRARRHAPPARDRRAAGQRLSRPPRARLSRRLHAVAGARGASCRAPARPAACSRWRSGSSATASSRSSGSRRRNIWTIAAELATAKNETFEARLVAVDGKKLDKFDIPDQASATRLEARARRRTLLGRHRREQVAAPQPRAALHHLDPAAGSLAQARLLAAPHHAARPAPLRGRRSRRRERGPHHLHAHRRRADRARGGLRDPPPRHQGLWRPLRAVVAAPIRDQGQERAGSPRGDPPDRLSPRHPTRSPAISIPTRPSSTNSSGSARSRARLRAPRSSAPPSRST